jgi:hypothetical protein
MSSNIRKKVWLVGQTRGWAHMCKPLNKIHKINKETIMLNE